MTMYNWRRIAELVDRDVRVSRWHRLRFAFENSFTGFIRGKGRAPLVLIRIVRFAFVTADHSSAMRAPICSISGTDRTHTESIGMKPLREILHISSILSFLKHLRLPG